MNNLAEITFELKRHKSHLFKNYPIKSLAVFGSFARDEQDADSDLDLLVEFSDNIGIRFIDLADELEELMRMKVDLVSRNGIKDKYFEVVEPELVYV
mgnify:CR=1 FL=1